MRDFYDIDALAERQSFDAQPLVESLRATFERRRTPTPSGVPLALTSGFSTALGAMPHAGLSRCERQGGRG